MQVQSLGREDPPEEGMGNHSSTLACRIPWTEESGRLCQVALKRFSARPHTHTHTHTTIVNCYISILCFDKFMDTFL